MNYPEFYNKIILLFFMPTNSIRNLNLLIVAISAPPKKKIPNFRC